MAAIYEFAKIKAKKKKGLMELIDENSQKDPIVSNLSIVLSHELIHKSKDPDINDNNDNDDSEISDKIWYVIFKYNYTPNDLAIMQKLEPDECLEALCYNTDVYTYIREGLRNDKTICYYALGINGLLMRQMPDVIKNDYLACKIAVQSHPESYKYIATEFYKSRDLCIEAVIRDGLMIKYSDFSLRNDPVIARIALDNNGMAMMYMSPAIQCHKGLALVALSNYGYAIQWCSEELRADPDIIATAYTHSPGSARFAMGAVPAPISPQLVPVHEEPILLQPVQVINKLKNEPSKNCIAKIKTNYNKYQRGKILDISNNLEECPVIINGGK